MTAAALDLPAHHAPGSIHSPNLCCLQATSSPRAHLALNVEPLRQSLAGLAGGDSDLRASLVAAAADGARGPAGAAAAAPAGASQFGELLGMQRRVVEEEEDGLRMNMASPVLLSRPGSAAATPATEAAGSEEAAGCAANVLAKRNLMDVLRSKETGAVRQQPLQAWQRQAGGAPPAKHAAGGRGGKAQAKASHVSLVQLLAAPAGGQAGPGGQPALAGQHSAGVKRGREALGASRPPSSGKL